MDFRTKIFLGSSFLRALLFNKRSPLLVSWSITERCNLSCQYCHAGHTQSPELPTGQVMNIIDSLKDLGTRLIKFTGGEPLLREDMVDIMNHAHSRGLAVILSTNGVLFQEKINKISKLDGVSLSLDGPEEIHDRIRGRGSYKKAIEAIKTAKEKHIPMSISATLNSLNLESVHYLLDCGKNFDSKVYFQPATRTLLYGKAMNPISPDVNGYRRAVLLLIDLKKKKNFIGNSMAALRHLYHWPNKTQINCMAGKIIVRIDAGGNIFPCPRSEKEENPPNILKKGLKSCFEGLTSPNCRDCWCSAFVEINMISRLNVSCIADALQHNFFHHSGIR
jgi:MoaA/NifB/PqqE/SkfB family radical SAM enzyme